MTPEEIAAYGEPLFNRGQRSATTATHRRCNKCLKWLEYAEFSRDVNRRPQITHTCIPCGSATTKSRRESNRRRRRMAVPTECGDVISLQGDRLTVSHKQCPKCCEWKLHSLYGCNNSNLLSLSTYCKDCEHAKGLERRYALSRDDYLALLSVQGGACKVCGSRSPECGKDNLFVDHDHVTGSVRGLLCHACNAMVGYSRDNPEILRNGAAYLEGGLNE